MVFAAAGGLVAALGFYERYDRYYHHDCGRDPGTASEIVMVGGEDVNNAGRRRQQLIKAWNDNIATTGMPRARLVELFGGTDQERAQMLAAQQLGSCAYDVLSLDVVWIPQFVRAGYVTELPGGYFDRSKFLDKPWQTGTGSDGRQYAIPFHSDVGLLYYRRDIIKKPPRTWAQLRRMTTDDALRKLGGEDPAGLAGQLADYEGLTVNGMEAVWGAGGTLEWRNGKIIVDKAAEAGLRRLTDGVASPLILKESAGFRETDSVAAFTAERVLFLRNWPYVYGVLAADPLLKKKFGGAELPGPAPGSPPGSGALGGQSLAIPKNAMHKEEARELIRFLTDVPQQQQLFACGGAVPVRTEVYEDKNIKACSRLAGQEQQNTPDSADQMSGRRLRELAAILEVALNRARPRPAVPSYPTFSRAFHRYLHDSLTQRTRPDADMLAGRLTACAELTSRQPACP